MPPNKTLMRGRNFVEQYYTGRFGEGATDLGLQPNEIKGSGTLAVAMGDYRLVLAPAIGTTAPRPRQVRVDFPRAERHVDDRRHHLQQRFRGAAAGVTRPDAREFPMAAPAFGSCVRARSRPDCRPRSRRRPRARAWTPPRTVNGQPDLQGVWLSNTATPLERPQLLEGRTRLTDEEVAEFRKRADRLFRSGNSDFAVGDGVYQAVLSNPSTYRNPNATHSAAEMVDLEFDNRTSLIVDPADGRIPPLTDGGRQRQLAVAAAFARPPAPPTSATRCAASPGACRAWAAATAPAT